MGNRTLKAGLFAALAAGALWVLPMSAWAAPVFPEGISADGESLAGKTWEDALHTAEEKVKDQADVSVVLTIEDKKAETTAGELGFHWSNQDEAEKELKSYVGGSLIRQYKRFCRYPLRRRTGTASGCVYPQRKWRICDHRVCFRKSRGCRCHGFRFRYSF